MKPFWAYAHAKQSHARDANFQHLTRLQDLSNVSCAGDQKKIFDIFLWNVGSA